MFNDVVIVSAVRTAIGDFGGSLKDISPSELGRLVIQEAVLRAGLLPADIHHVVMGQVIQSDPKDIFLARIAAVKAGIPTSAPALTLNRLCGSGVQAIVSAAQMIRLGECQAAVAGGAESMSRAPHIVPAMRWGKRMGDAPMLDAMLEALHDPFGHGHMGVTAENVAQRHAISRRMQDEAAVESHRRAARAIAEGRFEEQILPVEIRTRKGTSLFRTDEHVRGDTDLDRMSQLKPAFLKKNGTVTAGNASGLNDGAAALVLMSGQEAARKSAQPIARILGWGHAGVDPEVMGLGPVKAVPLALKSAGLALSDIDVIESNEAFAAQACAVASELGLDPERTNPNGSGISLGHPVGATGAIITVKAIYELKRIGGRYGLVTMCIGGGQGIAMVIERI
ncbi:beta-ketothiolase BktB [Sphingopyxis sp. J-6]|uniref:beta-ketothiolase BktB n=1 Tax=Sphingopyxis sp. J-6 TaxID=3122054 RepID=UPI0039840C02